MVIQPYPAWPAYSPVDWPVVRPGMTRYRWNYMAYYSVTQWFDVAKILIQVIKKEQPQDATIRIFEDAPYILVECPVPPKNHPEYAMYWEEVQEEFPGSEEERDGSH